MKVVAVRQINGCDVAFARGGWFNADEMAAAYGKEISAWMSRPSMKDRLAAVARRSSVAGGKVVTRSRQRLHPGVWLHPCLADTLGAWLGVEAADWLEVAVDQVKRHGDQFLKRSALDRYYLLECFLHDTESGLLVWRVDRPPSHFPSPTTYVKWRDQNAGAVAGWPEKPGYLMVSLDGVRLWQHHVVLAMNGIEIPDGMEVDHINGNPSDNRLENLRVVDRSTNRRNSRMHSNNTSGANGIAVCSGKRPYMAVGGANGVRAYIGNYATLREAMRARKEWERKVGGFTERHGTKD
ncbi:HNH endonuclease signature motif containing protein [Halomonas sp. B23F22_10]|uniref:HNH endonuclease signature motif containing protein n=1 Tax=Halomonas sp. B23F22_10 TaxID=3459515 RepID=UPI00373F0FCF